jgi:hypothetical protein
MARMMPNRTDNDIKNKYYAMVRKRERQTKMATKALAFQSQYVIPAASYHVGEYPPHPTAMDANAQYTSIDALNDLATVATLPFTYQQEGSYATGQSELYEPYSIHPASPGMYGMAPQNGTEI